MKENRRVEIILATLELASKFGLGAVSMSMIAEKVGIKKPSLYNHFESKEELVKEMYIYLKENAKSNTRSDIDNASMYENLTANEILLGVVNNYIKICMDANLFNFYKVIYSERTISPEASNIVTIETEKMIDATKNLFLFLESKNKLAFENLDISAISFALTIHGLIDYDIDRCFSNGKEIFINSDLIKNYITNFCNEHKRG